MKKVIVSSQFNLRKLVYTNPMVLLTEVEVIHAVGHQDVVEEDQTRVVDAFIEPVCSVCSVYILLCKETEEQEVT